MRFGSDEERMGVEFGWKVCGLSMELLVLGGCRVHVCKWVRIGSRLGCSELEKWVDEMQRRELRKR